MSSSVISRGRARQLLGVGADRALLVVETGAPPVEGDAVAEHRVAERLAQRLPVRDQAVQAAVGHRHDDRDHLAVRDRQVVRRHVQALEVGEPGAHPLRAEGVRLEDVRDEADLLARLAEQPLQVLREVLLGGDGEPAHDDDSSGHAGLRFSRNARDALARRRRLRRHGHDLDA
jgi:uncharacterized protein YggU (UPF0235/DUF167 family)